jgi:predicted choloylglycine hydrolase
MHTHFHSFVSSTPFDLGLQMGKKFQAQAKAALSKVDEKWTERKSTAEAMLPYGEKYFPEYIEELKGYAEGAQVDFLDFWTLSLEDDAFTDDEKNPQKCTTFITNDGLMLAHNEDNYEPGLQDSVCLVKKTLGDKTSLELFYYNTVGGTAVGINSHGFVQSINTLLYRPKQIGVPKCLIARQLMDTSDPDKDIEFDKTLKRASGYNHNIIHTQGKLWNVEFTMDTAETSQPTLPFVHTNHCLIHNTLTEGQNMAGTTTRLSFAQNRIHSQMTEEEAIAVQNDQSAGSNLSLHNERTIAKLIVNLATRKLLVWLLREDDKGWVTYDLDFIK